MMIFKKLEFIPRNNKGYSVAIGNFDGMHLGHQSVIKLAKETREDSLLGVITFEPHPREYFQKEQSLFRLMKSETRQKFLEKMNVDALFEIPFDKTLASLNPKTFVENVLIEKFNVKNVVVGKDFKFGKDRRGSVDLLQSYHNENKLKLTIANPFMLHDRVVSSTYIRRKLAEGCVAEVTKMLDRHYEIQGIVEKGFQRGRDLGFPTINVSIKETIVPKHGIYAVLVEIKSGENKKKFKGAASIGSRPTFGDYEPNIEVFIFDFNDTVYGQHVSIELIEFVRPELKFNSASELILQMKKDCKIVEKILDDLQS